LSRRWDAFAVVKRVSPRSASAAQQMALASTFFYLKTKPAAVIPRLSRSELFYPFIIPFWFHIPNAKQNSVASVNPINGFLQSGRL
jgi:hypothetical protein